MVVALLRIQKVVRRCCRVDTYEEDNPDERPAVATTGLSL